MRELYWPLLRLLRQKSFHVIKAYYAKKGQSSPCSSSRFTAWTERHCGLNFPTCFTSARKSKGLNIRLWETVLRWFEMGLPRPSSRIRAPSKFTNGIPPWGHVSSSVLLIWQRPNCKLEWSPNVGISRITLFSRKRGKMCTRRAQSAGGFIRSWWETSTATIKASANRVQVVVHTKLFGLLKIHGDPISMTSADFKHWTRCYRSMRIGHSETNQSMCFHGPTSPSFVLLRTKSPSQMATSLSMILLWNRWFRQMFFHLTLILDCRQPNIYPSMQKLVSQLDSEPNQRLPGGLGAVKPLSGFSACGPLAYDIPSDQRLRKKAPKSLWPMDPTWGI